MIQHSEIRNVIVGGLSRYLSRPVVLNNNADKMENYPFMTYTVINPRLDNYGEPSIKTVNRVINGQTKKMTQFQKIIEIVYSFTVISEDEDEAQDLLHQAVSFFDVFGVGDLKQGKIAVVEVSNVQNRDSLITIDYEHRLGFDVRLRVTEINEQESVYIESADIHFKEV